MSSRYDPICHCYYCDARLSPLYDYSCTSCGREACDNDSQACQVEGCDDITCVRCVSVHQKDYHLTGQRLM